MDNQAIKKLESDLWEAADLLRQATRISFRAPSPKVPVRQLRLQI